MTNLCPFDLEIGGVRYPKASEPLVLEPLLAERHFRLGDCPYRELKGFKPTEQLPRRPAWQLAMLGESQIEKDPRVIIPRLAPAISLVRQAGKTPLTVPLRFLDRRDKGAGAVVLPSEADLELAPTELAVQYKQDYPRPGRLGAVVRRVKGAFPLLVRNGPTFPPIPDDQIAVDHPDGTVTCPDVPEGTVAVIVPHSGPIVRAYEQRGLIVFVLSPVYPLGTVDLYRVA